MKDSYRWLLLFLLCFCLYFFRGYVNILDLPVLVHKTKTMTDEKNHPYGNPVVGPLHWEFDETLQKMKVDNRANIRMSAFAAKLPDPLPGEHDNIAQAADLLRGTVVKSGHIFSMNRVIGPYTTRRGFKQGPTYKGSQLVTTVGGGVCKIASVLYNNAILANLKIVERWSHSMQVPYVPPGQDATVSYGVKDIKFINTTAYPLLIWADTVGDILYIAFYGSEVPPKVTWHHQILNKQKYRTIYRKNYQLKSDEEREIIPGADGLTVKSWLTINYSDGQQKTKNLGIDYYRPLNRVVERGAK